MNQTTVDKIISNINKDLTNGDKITIAFQGGEPTAAGLEWYKYFAECIMLQRYPDKNITVNYALQTNGLLIDDDWAEFLYTHNFLTGLSIDANAKLHNAVRLDSQGEGTYDTCIRSKTILEKHKAEYNILCVLTNQLAAVPKKAWNFIKRENIRFVQFIPCLENPDENGKDIFALKPARFASFYTNLFSDWVKELEKGSYYSVKLFDDTINFFFRGIPSACGINGRCHIQFVVEADGSVYPCDFYALDQYNAGNLTNMTLQELLDSPVMQTFLREERVLPEICNICSYKSYCNGGCRRMSGAMYLGIPGDPSYGSVCGYKFFLDKCLKPLEHTMKKYF